MPAPRNRGQADGLRAQRERIRIAQTAAKLIAEHGLTDWAQAKRKAARQLLLPDTAPFPSNDEIEVALAEHHALFGGDAHADALRAQRIEALDWMRRLAPWQPLLAGGVAAGWATEYSDVRLELVADDPKAVEIALAGLGIAYAALPAREDDASAHLLIDSSPVAVRLVVLTEQQRRNRPRRGDGPHLNAEAVAALIAASGDAS